MSYLVPKLNPLPNRMLQRTIAARISRQGVGTSAATVVVEQDEDGMYVAEVPSLPGCVSQGQTREEAVENVGEAIAAYRVLRHDEERNEV
jgi:predicted RNase H-like HicB family nuclease